jgi:hypothetical protein
MIEPTGLAFDFGWRIASAMRCLTSSDSASVGPPFTAFPPVLNTPPETNGRPTGAAFFPFPEPIAGNDGSQINTQRQTTKVCLSSSIRGRQSAQDLLAGRKSAAIVRGED